MCGGRVKRICRKSGPDNYRNKSPQRRRPHEKAELRPISEDHSLNYCIFSWPPLGRVTRGASGPSMASKFISGSSCKRKNLNPTNRGFPDLSFFLRSFVEREIYESIVSSRTFGSLEWIRCTSPFLPWAINPTCPTKALPPNISFCGAPFLNVARTILTKSPSFNWFFALEISE